MFESRSQDIACFCAVTWQNNEAAYQEVSFLHEVNLRTSEATEQ